MRKVTVNKANLRKQLLENKADHEADFKITWKEYKTVLINRLHELVEEGHKLEPGDPIELGIYDLPQPENHTDDYQRAIEMLEWETGEEVVLEEHEFKQFVQDDWNWKNAFQTANSFYAGSASPSKFRP